MLKQLYDSTAANSRAIATIRVNSVAEIVAFRTGAAEALFPVEMTVEDSGIASTRAIRVIVSIRNRPLCC